MITARYGYQTSTAFTVSSPVAQPGAATLVFIFFGVGIARAWALFGLPGGGLLDLHTTRGSESGEPSGASAWLANAPGREPGARPWRLLPTVWPAELGRRVTRRMLAWRKKGMPARQITVRSDGSLGGIMGGPNPFCSA